MTYQEMEQAVQSLAEYIDSTVQDVTDVAEELQKRIFIMLQDEILKFEINEGAFVSSQDLRSRLSIINRRHNNTVNSYNISVGYNVGKCVVNVLIK